MKDYQKYINALRKCAKEHENDRTSTGHIIVSDLCKDTANLLEELEPKTGHWITHFDDLFPEESTMKCSECGDIEPFTISDNYCPNCGAKMESEDKE